MEFGILFTSHANNETEPYPHRDVHARVTREIVRADALGYDYAWIAEHHFSTERFQGLRPGISVVHHRVNTESKCNRFPDGGATGVSRGA